MNREICYYLSECKAKDIVLLEISSSCDQEFYVKLVSNTDATTECLYYEATKPAESSSGIKQLVYHYFEYLYGENLRLEIYSNARLAYSESFGSIMDSHGNNVGFSYNIFCEDGRGGDQDYNDIIISVKTWRGE